MKLEVYHLGAVALPVLNDFTNVIYKYTSVCKQPSGILNDVFFFLHTENGGDLSFVMGVLVGGNH